MTTHADHLTPAHTEEERQLLTLLYLCPVGIIELDGHGSILLINPYGAQMLMPIAAGKGLENLFDLFESFAPEVAEMARRFPSRAGRVCDELHVALPSRPGSNRDTVLSITLQKVETGMFVAVLTDVTSAAARELLVRASEERLHAVLDGVKDYAICTADNQGIITSWNRAAERMDDYRSDEAIGRPTDLLTTSSGVSKSPMARHLEMARHDGSNEFEGWRVRKDGRRYWASTSIAVLHGKHGTGQIGFSIITRDLTEARRDEDRLRALAMTDPLTGALNRRSFLENTRNERGAAANHECAVLLLDADFFKAINDNFGHDAGDATLQRIVADCRKEIRGTDVLGRFGGEEFAIFLPSSSQVQACAVAERIRERVAASGRTPGAYACTVSIGVAGASSAHDSIEAMIQRADVAMYEAKRTGRNRVVAAATDGRAELPTATA